MPSLGPRDVHLWLSPVPAVLPDTDTLLSAEERARASCFLNHAARHRYVAARTALRLLLGEYLSCAPERVPLLVRPGGKPALAGGECEFNLSHSRQFLFIGVARSPLGVDIEESRPSLSLPSLAARVCTPAERDYLLRLPCGDRLMGFLRLWTRKEAVLKASGEGIRLGMHRVEVLGDLTAGWRIYSFNPLPGVAAAAAFAPDALPPAHFRLAW